MLAVVMGTALVMIWRVGSPLALVTQATAAAPELGQVANQSLGSYLGLFVIWAAAIPVIPHIVMRVFTAKDPDGARLSLNLAMIFYSLMILAAVLAIVPVGKMQFPNLVDADQVFLRVMQSEFPPVFRGVAVAAVGVGRPIARAVDGSAARRDPKGDAQYQRPPGRYGSHDRSAAFA